MSAQESAAFAALPHAEAAVRLRRWDDGGKVDGLHVPDLRSYRERIARHML
jgi:gamma-butyrobetaine dioxygenase